MGNVAHLNVVPVDYSEGKPARANVIAQLESLLARARSGELQSFCIAYVRANGRPGLGECWGGSEDYCAMGTALLMAQHSFACAMEGQMVDAPPPQEPKDPA